MEKSCLHCGKTYKAKKKKSKFCSLHCFGLSNSEKVIASNKARRKYPHIEGVSRNTIMMRGNPQYYQNWLQKDKKKREDLIEYLGGKCVICGYKKDIRALQLDHINGNGYLDRKKKGRAKIYRYYIKNLKEAEQELQVLCANCNKIKQIRSKEFMLSRKKG